MSEPEPVVPMALTAAARSLCVTTAGVRNIVARGELQPLPDAKALSFDPVQVEEVRQRRQIEALQECALKRNDLVGLAERARQLLHPITTTRAGVDIIPGLPKTMRKIFGRASLKAAALRDGQGCRWCLARNLSQLYGTPAPTWAPMFVALFGKQAPCADDQPMMREALAGLRAQVHGPAVSPPEAAAAPSQASRRTPPAPAAQAVRTAAQRAVTAAAQPSRRTAAGDERFTVTRRVELQAALGSATREGDHRYAAQLRHLIKAL